MVINGRTDLASEVRRRLCDGSSVTELPGVRALEEELAGFPVTTVEILDQRGERALGKPRGTYITMELPRRLSEGFGQAARILAELIRRCAGRLPQRVFLAALGNPDITPDAIGSLAASRLLVTEHLKQRDPAAFSAFRSTLLCRPGVLGTAGMESARQIRALCRETRPELVIALDALAGADLQMLCRSVQICNTGIAPGSGVGNSRRGAHGAGRLRPVPGPLPPGHVRDAPVHRQPGPLLRPARGLRGESGPPRGPDPGGDGSSAGRLNGGGCVSRETRRRNVSPLRFRRGDESCASEASLLLFRIKPTALGFDSGDGGLRNVSPLRFRRGERDPGRRRRDSSSASPPQNDREGWRGVEERLTARKPRGAPLLSGGRRIRAGTGEILRRLRLLRMTGRGGAAWRRG